MNKKQQPANFPQLFCPDAPTRLEDTSLRRSQLSSLSCSLNELYHLDAREFSNYLIDPCQNLKGFYESLLKQSTEIVSFCQEAQSSTIVLGHENTTMKETLSLLDELLRNALLLFLRMLHHCACRLDDEDAKGEESQEIDFEAFEANPVVSDTTGLQRTSLTRKDDETKPKVIMSPVFTIPNLVDMVVLFYNKNVELTTFMVNKVLQLYPSLFLSFKHYLEITLGQLLKHLQETNKMKPASLHMEALSSILDICPALACSILEQDRAVVVRLAEYLKQLIPLFDQLPEHSKPNILSFMNLVITMFFEAPLSINDRLEPEMSLVMTVQDQDFITGEYLSLFTDMTEHASDSFIHSFDQVHPLIDSLKKLEHIQSANDEKEPHPVLSYLIHELDGKLKQGSQESKFNEVDEHLVQSLVELFGDRYSLAQYQVILQKSGNNIESATRYILEESPSPSVIASTLNPTSASTSTVRPKSVFLQNENMNPIYMDKTKSVVKGPSSATSNWKTTFDDRSFIGDYKEKIMASLTVDHHLESDLESLSVNGESSGALVEDEDREKDDLMTKSMPDLIEAYIHHRTIFDKSSRNSKERARLRERTALTHEQIEGWYIMFMRRSELTRSKWIEKYTLASQEGPGEEAEETESSNEGPEGGGGRGMSTQQGSTRDNGGGYRGRGRGKPRSSKTHHRKEKSTRKLMSIWQSH